MSFGPVCRGLACLFIAGSTSLAAGPVRVLVDFESETYPAGWQTTGEAFGRGPAEGMLDGQMPVGGFAGQRLANSFLHGDGTVGTLTSPEFTIDAPYLNFLIGGGNQPGMLGVNLIVDGATVATATGEDSEALSWATWDVRPWKGKTVGASRSSTRRPAAGDISISIRSSFPRNPAYSTTATPRSAARWPPFTTRFPGPRRPEPPGLPLPPPRLLDERPERADRI